MMSYRHRGNERTDFTMAQVESQDSARDVSNDEQRSFEQRVKMGPRLHKLSLSTALQVDGGKKSIKITRP